MTAETIAFTALYFDRTRSFVDSVAMEKPTGEKLLAPQLTMIGRDSVEPPLPRNGGFQTADGDLHDRRSLTTASGSACPTIQCTFPRLCRASPCQTWRDYFSAESL